MGRRLFRLAYIIEYLVALAAVFIVWSEVGGQSHLDLMAWYWKLIPAAILALLLVRATIAAVESEKAWNVATARWLSASLLVAVVMGAMTYYEHLNEPADEDTDEDTPETMDVGRRRADGACLGAESLGAQLSQIASDTQLPRAARKLQ